MAVNLTVLLFAWAWCPRHMLVKAVIAMTVYGPGVIYSVLMWLGLTDASAGLAMVALAASASINMALTFSLERGLCANVRLEKLWPSLHAKQISSPSGLRP